MQTFLSDLPIANRSHTGNSFDLIRFVAAFGVLFSHSFALLGKPEPRFYGGHTLGSLCVFVFFAVSGYLVMTSWDRTQNVRTFVINRGLRIFPALLVCLTLCAFILGPSVTSAGFTAYFSSTQPFAFVATNLAMFTSHVENGLPHTFQNLPISKTINGSLWTIKYEIFMYVTLLAVVCVTLKISRVIAFLLVSFIVIWTVGTYQGLAEPGILLWRLEKIGLGGKLLNLAPFFLVGALIARAPHHYLRFEIAAMFIAIAMMSYQSTFAIVVLWFVLPYCVLTLAYNSPEIFHLFGKKGDFSYGMYLYAFPVQQTLTHLHLLTWWMHFLLSTFITLCFAILSWKLIESPALKLKFRFSKNAAKKTRLAN